MSLAVVFLAYDPDKVKPGWIALFVVLGLAVATFLLWRSMNTQLGKIQVPPRRPRENDDATPAAEQAKPAETDEDGSEDADSSRDD